MGRLRAFGVHPPWPVFFCRHPFVRENQALQQRVKDLEASFMVCFAIFTKMGMSGDAIKVAKGMVRVGRVPQVEVHLQPIVWDDSLLFGDTMGLQDSSHVVPFSSPAPSTFEGGGRHVPVIHQPCVCPAVVQPSHGMALGVPQPSLSFSPSPVSSPVSSSSSSPVMAQDNPVKDANAMQSGRAGEFHKRNKGSFPQALKTRLTPFKPEERGHQVPGRFRP